MNGSRSNYFYQEDKDCRRYIIQRRAEKERKFRMAGVFLVREETAVLLHTPLLYRRKSRQENERRRKSKRERERGNCSK